ncbi:MAG: GNAT family N-acetyltransferase [Chitinophagales bacterium]
MLIVNFSPFPVLYTTRLVLKALSKNDALSLAEMRSNSRVNEFLDRADTMSLKDAGIFIENRIKDAEENESIMWAIHFKEQSKMLGSICYWNIVAEKDKAEIGYEMHPDYYGKGIMHEAMQAVIEYGFSMMKLKVIEAFPVKDNIKSIKLLERNHFVRDYDIDNYSLSETERLKTAVFILKNDTTRLL